jgi:L-alanine-DL-glutamate epimerase-like enolase superfamily enzyme
MLSRLADYRPFWMEEPLLSDDREGYLRLKAEFPQIPLAWGENAFSASEYQRFVDAFAVDFVMPDPGRSGGLTQCIRLCETADRKGIPFSPHHFGSDLGFAATLQLIAAKPLFAILLRDISHCPLREEIIETPFEIKDGSVAIPDKPGLGVSPNWKMIEKYQAT